MIKSFYQFDEKIINKIKEEVIITSSLINTAL